MTAKRRLSEPKYIPKVTPTVDHERKTALEVRLVEIPGPIPRQEDCVTSGHLFNFSKPQFLHLKIRN